MRLVAMNLISRLSYSVAKLVTTLRTHTPPREPPLSLKS